MPMRLHVLVVSASVRHAATSSVFVVCRFITSHHLSPLLIYLSYFLTIDLLGFLALVLLDDRPSDDANHGLRYVDLFFMSTSAVTVTGLATVRMERLSSSQTVVLTVLMLQGSEMFVSFLGLALASSSRKRKQPQHGHPDHDHDGRVCRSVSVACDDDEEAANPPSTDSNPNDDDDDDQEKKRCCLRGLALLVLVYMIVILVLGSLTVFLYVANVPSARDVLTKKSINVALFSASVTVSSFTNGGLLPTNESMAVFATNQGLLLLLTGQILAGSTLFPVFLRLLLRATAGLARVLDGRPSSGRHEDELVRFTSKHAAAAGFAHLLLLPGGGLQQTAAFVAATAVAVAAAAVTLFCCLNWDTAVFAGLTTAGEKVTNALFMAVNARQAGENSVDCSLIAPAVLVLFVAMMCAPASTSFILVHYGHDDGGERSGGGELERKKDDGAKKTRLSLNSMFMSPLAFNAAAVTLVCVTERRSLSNDPLNFSTFNVMFEVISAYRNVGLSTGYSCSRLLLRPEAAVSVCHDQPYSFSGWWSDHGKLVIVLVMLCGRLKGFYRQQRRT